MTATRDASCPLCGAPGPFEGLVDVTKRRHRVCGRCALIFVETEFLPAPGAERERYAKHQNGPADAGYVAFLRQAIDPALPRLTPAMRGLDYGCGPVPTLCSLLESAGLRCENYDPFFFPDCPAGPFDFLFATEVVEHFFNPLEDWKRMAGLLRSGGLLVVMTAPWVDRASFRTWNYANDETHVAFYHRRTFDWLADAIGFDVVNGANPRVVLLFKR